MDDLVRESCDNNILYPIEYLFHDTHKYTLYIQQLLKCYTISDQMYEFIAIVIQLYNLNIVLDNFNLIKAIKTTNGDIRKIYLTLLPNVNMFYIKDIDYLYDIGYGNMEYFRKLKEIKYTDLLHLVAKYKINIALVYKNIDDEGTKKRILPYILGKHPALKNDPRFKIDFHGLQKLDCQILVTKNVYTPEEILLIYFNDSKLGFTIPTIGYLISNISNLNGILKKYNRNDNNRLLNEINKIILNQV